MRGGLGACVATGKDVMHFRLHVWPRREKAELRLASRDEPQYEGNELAETADRLLKATAARTIARDRQPDGRGTGLNIVGCLGILYARSVWPSRLEGASLPLRTSHSELALAGARQTGCRPDHTLYGLGSTTRCGMR